MKLRNATKVGWSIVAVATATYTLVNARFGSIALEVVITCWAFGRIMTEGVEALASYIDNDDQKSD